MSKQRLLSTACAAAILAGIGGPVWASGPTAGPPPAPVRHWYASVFGGYAFSTDHEFDFINNGTGGRFHYQAPLSGGYTVGGAVGVVVNPNVRVEVEVAYSSQDFENTYFSPTSGFVGQNASGSLDVFTVMANVWFNANWGQWRPYAGGGIGIGHVDGNLRITNGAGQQFNGDDTGLALQLGAGVRYAISSNVELDLSYRLRGVLDVNLGSSIAGFSTTSEDVWVQSIQLGLNFRF